MIVKFHLKVCRRWSCYSQRLILELHRSVAESESEVSTALLSAREARRVEGIVGISEINYEHTALWHSRNRRVIRSLANSEESFC